MTRLNFLFILFYFIFFAVMTTNKPERFLNVGALTKTNWYPHVYSGGRNLKYDSDKLCYASVLKEVQITVDEHCLSQSQITTHSSIITVNQ